MSRIRGYFGKKAGMLLVANLLALVAYFSIVYMMGWPATLDSTVLATIDAQSYLASGRILLGQSSDFSAYDPLLYRPFLFPVLLAILLGSGSMLPFWILQFAAWLFAINATWLIIHRTSARPWVASAGALALAAHPGLIGLTMHGLTEVLTVALVAAFLLVWVTVKESSKRMLLLIAFASLLSVVRPVFLFLLLVIVIRAMPLFRKNGWRYAGIACLMVLPVLVQLGLMYANYGELFLSRIGSGTLRNHLAAQIIGEAEGLGLEQARAKAWLMSSPEILTYFASHLTLSIKVYALNVADNVWNYSHALNYPVYQNKLSRLALICNQTLSISLIISMIIGVIRASAGLWKNLWLPGLICLLVIGSSGISFGEGDRLWLTSLVPGILIIATVFNSLLIEANGKE